MINTEKIEKLFDLAEAKSIKIMPCDILDIATLGKTYYKINGVLISMSEENQVNQLPSYGHMVNLHSPIGVSKKSWVVVPTMATLFKELHNL